MKKGWVQFQVDERYANGNSLRYVPKQYEKVKYQDSTKYLRRKKQRFAWDIPGDKKQRLEALSKYHGSIRKDLLYIYGVTSYLPYKKGVYFPSTEKEKISVGAERQRRYRAMKRWRADPTEENFWGVVLAYAGVKFKTYSGLPFSYEIKKGRNGEYTKELWIDRREKSKSLAWSSVLLALKNIKGEVVDRPKALGDIRGVTYIYGMFYRFGLIDVPDEVKEKMGHLL